IFVLGLGTLIGCQSIEHRSDTIKKNKLVALADEQTEVIVKKQWIKKFGKGVGKKDPLLMIAGSKDILVVADHEGQIYQVDKNNGNARWSTKLNKEVSAGPTISEDLVFVGTSGG